MRQIDDADGVAALLDRADNGAFLVMRGIVYEPPSLRAVVAERDGAVAGFAPYCITGNIAFVAAMNNTFGDEEITRALLASVEALCRRAGRSFLRAITSNDSIELLGTMQQLGYRIVAIWPDAMRLVRELKPRLPAVAANGVPIVDEIELEIAL
jgi:hypothetical protein